MFNLSGKTAVVTGASSGLGVQFAEALADAGADLAILARRMERLESLREKIRKMGGAVLHTNAMSPKRRILNEGK